MLTVLALIVAVVLLAGVLKLVGDAMGGCFLSNLFVWMHLGDLLAAVGGLLGFVWGQLAGDE